MKDNNDKSQEIPIYNIRTMQNPPPIKKPLLSPVEIKSI